MIINVFGSTKNEAHFGCKSLSHGLDNLLIQKFSNNAVIDHTLHKYLSLGFVDSFRKPFNIGRRKVVESLVPVFLQGKKVPVHSQKELDVSYSNWVKSLSEIKKDYFLKNKILISDLNIINVEGTIHDQNIYGLHLLALSKVIRDLGKEVQWVNVTIANEDKRILNDSIGDLVLPTREDFSYDYITGNGLKAIKSFDTSVLAPFNIEGDYKNISSNKVLITGSVSKESVDLNNIIATVKKVGKIPVYIPAEFTDLKDLDLVKKAGVEYVELASINYLDIPQFIRQFDFVISGRHHLNILSAIAGVPFIPLHSNTWKTQGIVKYFELEKLFVANLEEACNYLMHNKDKIEQDLSIKIELAKKLALSNLS